MKKRVVLPALLALTACQPMPQSSVSGEYEQALKLWNAQPQDEAVMQYLQRWITYNNDNGIDSRGDCYAKNSGPVELILLIDQAGVVKSVVANVDNDKSRCFRQAFMNVHYPAPPFPDFRRRLRMGH